MKYIILLLALFLAGCCGHTYRASKLPLECTDLQENVQEALETCSVCEGVYPSEQWWHFFQDPQLSYLIELSLEAHPSIKMAAAQVYRAREVAIETRSALLPHIYLFGDITREKLSEFGSRTDGSTLQYITEASTYLTSASYELDIWQKNRHAYYASLDEMFAEMADYEEAKLILSTTIASVYFNMQFHLELLGFSKERLQAKEELYSLLHQQFQNGVISEFFLYQTDTEVQMLTDLVLQQEGMLEIDSHAIAALVGNAACLSIDIEPAATFSAPIPLPASLPIDLLVRRPDLIALKNRVEASCFNVAVAKANFFPRIDLLGYIGFTSFKLSEFFTGRTLSWVGDATSSMPLYTASKLKAQLGISRENFEIAIEEYNQGVLDAVQEVSDALTNLKVSDARIAALEKSVRDAEALFRLTYQRYESGVADRIPVLNGMENVLAQQEIEVGVQLQRFLAAISLIKAMGGGYCE